MVPFYLSLDWAFCLSSTVSGLFIIKQTASGLSITRKMSHSEEITDVRLLYFQNALHATSPCVWLPYTAMDQLLVLLKDVQPDSELAKVRPFRLILFIRDLKIEVWSFYCKRQTAVCG